MGQVKAVSSFYETEPVDVIDQPWFLNCVVALEANLAPRDLLGQLLAIETQAGRIRATSKGPRILDIDILLAGESVIAEPGVTIPHPAMHERRFVLEPLAEIASGAMHPILKKSASELLAALPQGQIVRRLSSAASPDSPPRPPQSPPVRPR